MIRRPIVSIGRLLYTQLSLLNLSFLHIRPATISKFELKKDTAPVFAPGPACHIIMGGSSSHDR